MPPLVRTFFMLAPLLAFLLIAACTSSDPPTVPAQISATESIPVITSTSPPVITPTEVIETERPTSTPIPTREPTPTLSPTATPAPTLLPTPTQTSTPMPPPTSTSTPTPTNTPSPTPTPTPEPDPYQLLLQLTNQHRAEAGLTELALGDNPAAQMHAERSLTDCISSHWDTNGLMPVMRYSLAGGYQANQENVSGIDYCKTGALGYSPISSVSEEVRAAVNGWMNSPGHRDALLDPRHRKLSIGLAWDDYNFRAVQQFEGDYVEFSALPNIQNGIFTMEGTLRNGANLEHGDHYRVAINWSPPPEPLTRGQIARAYGTCPAKRVANLSFKSAGELERTWEKCLSPSDISPDTPGPSSRLEARELWEEAKETYFTVIEEIPITADKIKMSRFQVDGDEFAITADVNKTIQKHGDGVYEIIVWGIVDGEVELLVEYALFHGVVPPAAYLPR